MEIREQNHEGFVTLIPVGDLDANSSINMDDKIQEQIEKDCYRIHVDCSELQYISSAGLGVFISFMDELEENGGRFVFSNLSQNIRKVFELLGLDQMMLLVDTQEQAKEAILK